MSYSLLGTRALEASRISSTATAISQLAQKTPSSEAKDLTNWWLKKTTGGWALETLGAGKRAEAGVGNGMQCNKYLTKYSKA